jgi:parvulin-like peptidyl-prolyl isomerase
MKRLSLLLLAAFSLTAGEVIDRVAAVVNEDIILVSEVEEKLFILDAQGQLKGRDTTEFAKLRKEDRPHEEKLIVQRAKSQGINADASDLQKRVDEAMEKVRSQFPSLEAFREALRQEGITESMLRERYQTDIEQELLGQRIVAKEVRTLVEVNSDEVDKYYREHKDELPRKPTELRLAHILIRPVDAATERAAQERIDQYARIRPASPSRWPGRPDDPSGPAAACSAGSKKGSRSRPRAVGPST